jgi:hypothetical protein
MKAFDFDHHLIENYAHFSRSFSIIRAKDLRDAISREYDDGRFWPDALLSLNPRYEAGPSVDDLVASGDIDPDTARVFRFGSTPLQLHAHQGQAIAKAQAGQSFVVTTGTGSGKSLCFFVPIIDAIIRARKAGYGPRTRAIIVYPMNALANSQLKEIEKFVGQSGLPNDLRPSIRRYTGQESREERQSIAANPPDVLLTNFMMAELLLTRQDETDARVIENARDLEFIVLDELHTYRGRQGADVAILVRRLRDRCAPGKAPICIGTSATMASEGNDEDRAKVISDVASRLFGTIIGPDAVIDESLRRATDDTLALDTVIPQLAAVLENDLSPKLTDAILARHPLAVWIELALGLDDGLVLKRRKPIPFGEASDLLSQASGVAIEQCRKALEQFLTRVSLPERERGGSGEHAFLAFKLHRFISGAGDVYTTLRPRPRRVLLDGQLEDPDAPGVRLYPTRFCRQCGQEYHVVTKTERPDGVFFLPRNIDDTPIEDDDDADVAGYLTPTGDDDPEYRFDGTLDNYPESWVEERGGNPPWERIKLQEQEFFAARSPEIAGAPNKAARERLIKALHEAEPGTPERALHESFFAARRQAEATSEFVRTPGDEGGRFALTGRGDVNTYALFAELFASLARDHAGVIVPTGIATDATTAPFFAALVGGKRLARLVDFENRAKLFPAVDSRMKFCLLTLGRDELEAKFAFFLTDPAQLAEPERNFTLSPETIAGLNPNTKTAPVFRSRADAELTAKIYANAPVLIEDNRKDGNVWNLQIQTRLWHMTEDVDWFRDHKDMILNNATLDGQTWLLSGT